MFVKTMNSVTLNSELYNITWAISAITTINFQRLNLIVIITTMSSLGDYDDKFWEIKCNRRSAKTSHPHLRNNFLQCNSFLLFWFRTAMFIHLAFKSSCISRENIPKNNSCGDNGDKYQKVLIFIARRLKVKLAIMAII